MKILVTGGAGYIGSHLVDKLLAAGEEVCVVDNLTTGNIENIKHNLSNPRFQFTNDSVLNETLMERLIKESDVIYHLAAAVGVKHIVDDPLTSIKTNVKGTDIVLDLAHRYWKKTLIASTSEIYGKSNQIPFDEHKTERVLGSTKIDRWAYSTSKAIDEHLAFAYSKKGLPVVIVRYFNSYGPRIDEGGYGTVVARFIKQALKGKPITVHGDGKQTRCFTYVDDTVRGTISACTTNDAEGDVYNIGSNQETSIYQLAELIKELTGSSSEITQSSYESYYGKGFEDTVKRVPSIVSAKKKLRFEAKVSLQEGLKRTIEWCKENYSY
ncbi:GDP-mannose 4,6-dehydratase [bacterium]|nr:GDP-mannose 4,6-dehydratase [bacterium]MBU1598560.1 GDP-mannose 4,6-dehydratase [bacterium]MBU2462040.1 GDP-mannose 4,6-dehydratase [bacterium]